MHFFGVVVFFGWFMYTAIDGSNFGSQPSCNDRVNFVLLFNTIRATVTWFRVTMIVYYGVTLPLFLLYLGFLIIAPAQRTKECTDALQRVYDRYPRIGVFRYLIGIP